MTLTEIIQSAREDFLDDAVTPYLWSDIVLARYANEAEKEACRRASLLSDKTTAQDGDSVPLCSLTLVPGTAKYTISKNTPLTDAMEESLDRYLGPNRPDRSDIENLDVAVMNVIEGKKDASTQSIRIAAVLDAKVKNELGIRDTAGDESPEVKPEEGGAESAASKDIVLEDHEYEIDGETFTYLELETELTLGPRRMSKAEAQKAIRGDIDAKNIKVK